MHGLTSSLNGKLALRQPPREITGRKARLALSTGMPAAEAAHRILINDPLAAINVLRRANDAYYGLRGSIGSLSHAIEIVGAESCLRLLTETGFSSADRPAQTSLIRHASVAAQISHRLANGHWLGDEGHGFQPGMVATTSLLHNIGRLAFSVSLPLESDSLYGFGDSPFPLAGSLSDLEQLQFGINHVELGAFILHHLHFPDEMKEAVRSHRCVGDTPEPSHPSRLAWMVGASCLLAEAAGYGLDPQVSFGQTIMDSWLAAYDGHAAFTSGDLERIRQEVSDADRLVLDDDPWFSLPDRNDTPNAENRIPAGDRESIHSARIAHPTFNAAPSSRD